MGGGGGNGVGQMSHGFVNLEPPPPKTKEVPCGQ